MGEDRALVRRKESMAGCRSGGKGKAMSWAALLAVSMLEIRVGSREVGSGCWIKAVYAVSWSARESEEWKREARRVADCSVSLLGVNWRARWAKEATNEGQLELSKSERMWL